MKIYQLIIVVVSVIGCTNKDCSQESFVVSTTAPVEYSLIGKKGEITYPKFKAEVFYLTDSTLEWKTTDNNGVVNKGKEKMVYRKIADTLYFLSWIENDGLTISQVIDTKNGSVNAFGSFNDEKSTRGNRSGMAIDGTFKFVDK